MGNPLAYPGLVNTSPVQSLVCCRCHCFRTGSGHAVKARGKATSGSVHKETKVPNFHYVILSPSPLKFTGLALVELLQENVSVDCAHDFLRTHMPGSQIQPIDLVK